jgi:hypothetical protein
MPRARAAGCMRADAQDRGRRRSRRARRRDTADRSSPAQGRWPQRTERLRLQARMDDLRRATELPRHDPQPWPRSMEVRPTRPLRSRERSDHTQQIFLTGPQRSLAMVRLAFGCVEHDEVATAVHAHSSSCVLAPELQVQFGELFERTTNSRHRGTRNRRTVRRGLGLPQPVDDPQPHQVREGPELHPLRRDRRNQDLLTRPIVHG